MLPFTRGDDHKRMRLGFGIMVCVPEYTSPIRIAERTATLDIISGGRLDVGTGRSATWTNWAASAPIPNVTKKTWTNMSMSSPRCGRRNASPMRAVLLDAAANNSPEALSEAAPPMWVAVSSPHGTRCAERGMGSSAFLRADGAAGTVLKRYRKVIQNCDPVGDFVNNTSLPSISSTATRTTNRRSTPRRHHQHVHAAGDPVPAQSRSAADQARRLAGSIAWRALAGGNPREGSAIGDPHQSSRIEEVGGMGVDCVNFMLNCVEVVPQEKVLASLRSRQE